MIDWEEFWNKSLEKSSKNLEKYLNILNRKKKIDKIKNKCIK